MRKSLVSGGTDHRIDVPDAAATYGFANFSVYSATFCGAHLGGIGRRRRSHS